MNTTAEYLLTSLGGLSFLLSLPVRSLSEFPVNVVLFVYLKFLSVGFAFKKGGATPIKLAVYLFDIGTLGVPIALLSSALLEEFQSSSTDSF